MVQVDLDPGRFVFLGGIVPLNPCLFVAASFFYRRAAKNQGLYVALFVTRFSAAVEHGHPCIAGHTSNMGCLSRSIQRQEVIPWASSSAKWPGLDSRVLDPHEVANKMVEAVPLDAGVLDHGQFVSPGRH
jgi:hypothetical protein